jgi:hypothetical protein
MIEDLVQAIIDKNIDGCWNCQQTYKCTWLSGDFECSGVVKSPIVTSFDVIRLCKCTGEDIKIQDMSPDEALTVIALLSDSVNAWLHNSKHYQEFRQDKGDLIFGSKET